MTICQPPATDSAAPCPEIVMASVAPQYPVRKMYVYGEPKIQVAQFHALKVSVHCAISVRSQLSACQSGTEIHDSRNSPFYVILFGRQSCSRTCTVAEDSRDPT
jgi:hypothetical protein